MVLLSKSKSTWICNNSVIHILWDLWLFWTCKYVNKLILFSQQKIEFRIIALKPTSNLHLVPLKLIAWCGRPGRSGMPLWYWFSQLFYWHHQKNMNFNLFVWLACMALGQGHARDGGQAAVGTPLRLICRSYFYLVPYDYVLGWYQRAFDTFGNISILRNQLQKVPFLCYRRSDWSGEAMLCR